MPRKKVTNLRTYDREGRLVASSVPGEVVSPENLPAVAEGLRSGEGVTDKSMESLNGQEKRPAAPISHREHLN